MVVLYKPIAHDKGKPVVKQGRKAKSLSTRFFSWQDSLVAEGIEEADSSFAVVCLLALEGFNLVSTPGAD